MNPAPSNLLIEAAAPAQRRVVISADNTPSEGMELELWSLPEGVEAAQTARDRETLIVILGGQVKFDAGTVSRVLGEREDVFSGSAAAAYIPPGVAYRITPIRAAELAAITAPAEGGLEPYAIQPHEVRRELRGEGTWQREVHTILDIDRPARRLIVGETFNPPGGWSSYPPHKHDRQQPPGETQLQELYHYRFQPQMGFALQGIYSPERTVAGAMIVRHGDSVLIPYGYHPVVAAPGYRLYYLWALAGATRDLRLHEDPDHSWVRTPA